MKLLEAAPNWACASRLRKIVGSVVAIAVALVICAELERGGFFETGSGVRVTQTDPAC